MVDSTRQTIVDLAQKIRANRTSPEITTVIQWIDALEESAVENLVSCNSQDHDTCASKVHLLRLMRKQIAEPSFSERQARYQETQYGG